jgi:DNA topoisomerase-1
VRPDPLDDGARAASVQNGSVPAGLVFTSDEEPGIRRRGRRRFHYVDDRGQRIHDAKSLARIRALAVPPAWTDVWICADSRGHIQATGRDARGRKQYRYHTAFRTHRDSTKFDELVAFGRALGGLRRRVDDDLAAPGLGYKRMVALVVLLLGDTYVRVGNECYAQENGSYGLTTLRKRHAAVNGATLRLRFVGKHGARVDVKVVDRRLARLVCRCQDLPGQLLFQYEDDDGQLRPIRSGDVNDYLRDATGLDATAKTFRTWGASVRAAAALAALGAPARARQGARELNAVIDEVARHLGNTRAVCRRSYIHPLVIQHFEAGSLPELWAAGPARRARGLDADERKLLHVLRTTNRRLAGAA